MWCRHPESYGLLQVYSSARGRSPEHLSTLPPPSPGCSDLHRIRVIGNFLIELNFLIFTSDEWRLGFSWGRRFLRFGWLCTVRHWRRGRRNGRDRLGPFLPPAGQTIGIFAEAIAAASYFVKLVTDVLTLEFDNRRRIEPKWSQIALAIINKRLISLETAQ